MVRQVRGADWDGGHLTVAREGRAAIVFDSRHGVGARGLAAGARRRPRASAPPGRFTRPPLLRLWAAAGHGAGVLAAGLLLLHTLHRAAVLALGRAHEERRRALARGTLLRHLALSSDGWLQVCRFSPIASVSWRRERRHAHASLSERRHQKQREEEVGQGRARAGKAMAGCLRRSSRPILATLKKWDYFSFQGQPDNCFERRTASFFLILEPLMSDKLTMLGQASGMASNGPSTNGIMSWDS